VRTTPVALSLAALALLVGLTDAAVAQAQASALGNPYGPGDHSATAPADTLSPAATVTPPSSAPPSYSDVAVPPAPGGGIYAAPRVPSVVADSPSVHIGTSIATRLRALDADLQILSARGGGSVIDGIMMIVMAGATAGWGAFMQVSAPPGVEPYQAYYLYLSAGVSITRAILTFALMTNPSQAAIQYSHMPMTSEHDVRARLRFGEAQLDSLADSARLLRILDGSLNLAGGVAVLPFVFATGTFDTGNFANWGLLLLGGLQAVFGVVSLVSTTEAERRQSAYHELRDRLLSTPDGMQDEDDLDAAAGDTASRVDVQPIVSIGSQGGLVGAAVTF
jgi:hypothetical protein